MPGGQGKPANASPPVLTVKEATAAKLKALIAAEDPVGAYSKKLKQFIAASDNYDEIIEAISLFNECMQREKVVCTVCHGVAHRYKDCPTRKRITIRSRCDRFVRKVARDVFAKLPKK